MGQQSNHYRSIWLLLLLAGLLLGGCGLNPRRLAEKKVEAQLPRLIAPAKRYRVYLYGRHERMFHGKVQAVRIVGEGVEIQPNLLLRDVVIELEEVEYQEGSSLKAQSGTFHASLDDEALRSYLQTLLPPVRSPWNMVVSHLGNLQVRSRAGDLRLSIDVHTRLGVKLSGELSGQLRLREGTQIWFEATEIRAIGISLPEKVRDFLAELFLNRPLIDLSDVKAPIRVERVAVGEGMLLFEGTILVERLAQLLSS